MTDWHERIAKLEALSRDLGVKVVRGEITLAEGIAEIENQMHREAPR